MIIETDCCRFQDEFAGYNPYQNDEDEDAESWLPPHTPPREELLQTCTLDVRKVLSKPSVSPAKPVTTNKRTYLPFLVFLSLTHSLT